MGFAGSDEYMKLMPAADIFIEKHAEIRKNRIFLKQKTNCSRMFQEIKLSVGTTREKD